MEREEGRRCERRALGARKRRKRVKRACPGAPSSHGSYFSARSSLKAPAAIASSGGKDASEEG